MKREIRELFDSIDFSCLERDEIRDICRDIDGAKRIAGEEDERVMMILQEAKEKAERRKKQCRMG